MDYEKRYNELIDAIKEMLEANPHDEGLQNWVQDNVPELTESEDERIRESAIKLLRRIDSAVKWSQDGYTLGDIIAWLEKQVEQKSDWSDEDCYKVQRICMYLNEAKKYYADITEVRECIEWLKFLKERINYKKGGEE